MIVQKVATRWEDLALFLDFNYDVIKIIRDDNKHESCVKACQDMLHRWLEGEACHPITWGRLIEAISDAELATFARKLKEFLKP